MTFTYGPEGELRGVSGAAEPWSATYDAAYRISSISDGNSHSTSYSYSTAGYLSQISFPSGGGTAQFPSYDPVGNLLQRVDGRSVTTNYLYSDAANGLSDVQYPATPALNMHFTYDAYGRANSATDGYASYTPAYDDRDALTSLTTTYTGLPARTISYGYYNDGSRASMTLPAGTAVAYSYNGRGELVGLTDPYSNGFSWSYLDNGWTKTQTLPGSVTSTWTYDSWGEPTDLTTKAGSTLLAEYGSVTYDGVGNTASVTASVPAVSAYGGLTSYQYSGTNQLTQEQSARNGSYTYGFGYDSAGNPTTFKGVGHTFNTNNQDTGNVYDLEGNPTTYKGTGMTWNPEDQLTGVGSTWTAGYRADGLRAWKNNNGTKTYFLYDGGTPVVELDASGNVIAQNVYGAMGLLTRHTTASHDYTFDLQRNVAQRVTPTGSVEASFSFDCYGVGHVTGSVDSYGFGAQDGYYTDTDTGLQAMSYRYYDAAAGRWLNRDPISYSGGSNLYAFCSNQPVNVSDPSGLKAFWIEQPPSPAYDVGIWVPYNPGPYGGAVWNPPPPSWMPLQPYHHAYIRFDMRSPTTCRGKNYGVDVDGNWIIPDVWGWGIINPSDRGGNKIRGNDDPNFEWALCACVENASKRPVMYWLFGGNCGSWVKDMWKCASNNIHSWNFN